MCNENQETRLHSLVECSFAQQCWYSANLKEISGTSSSFYNWLQLVFQQRSNEEIHSTSMIGWMLWKNRNDVVWNKKGMNFSSVVTSAFSVFNQWNFVQDKSFSISMGFMTQEDGSE